ncbi:NAD(P)H-hydrate epimerase [Prosthecobacter fusiformis]|uniref:ADP-dependent (S)-NAD(P)H-hydrate dehydratase n=1 Tax=Prosthecobacter fusiformis TaxID=48464 RepID=A0A4R7S640_9BACT|nr:NAD(P)H-hydrate dehydratase [Prosthecobacter fusiformis]TDU73018.1 NAD(P)H-hydrate epimerase [Prosthecobacter fusiformis]
MLVTCRQMQEMEERAFASGISPADLMLSAGTGIAQLIRQFFPQPGTLGLYLGSGNNAGDALVAARELQKDGWEIYTRFSGDVAKLKPLPAKHWRALKGVERRDTPPTEIPKAPLVLLDGLLGIGAHGPLRPHIQALASEMNALRISHRAVTVAMDIPSGLDADAGVPEKDCVIADITATVAIAKQGLVADLAINHVGRLAVVPLPQLAAFGQETDDRSVVLTPEFLRTCLPRRRFDFHKGQAGRVGILAGSRGYFGAAELACRGALRAGAGLVTLFVKEDAYDILARRVPAEVMVKAVKDYREVLEMRMDALGIGPGLGFDHEDEYLEVIEKAALPAVVDADALTALSRHPSLLNRSTSPRLLTPHPGEMARLMPEGSLLCRCDQAETWAQNHPGHTLLLKGARTVISTHGLDTLINTTGHPGMAAGGMGDVLTGVSSALIGQGISPHHTAGMAAWLCGRAAELHALSQSAESTLPSDVIAQLGKAWAEL